MSDSNKGLSRLDRHLSILFAPRQKDLVLMKLRGERMTKTEREYYSRVVKKKLESVASEEMREVARALTKPDNRFDL